MTSLTSPSIDPSALQLAATTMQRAEAELTAAQQNETDRVGDFEQALHASLQLRDAYRMVLQPLSRAYDEASRAYEECTTRLQRMLSDAMGENGAFYALLETKAGHEAIQRIVAQGYGSVDVPALEQELHGVLGELSQTKRDAMVEMMCGYAELLGGEQIADIARLGHELAQVEHQAGIRASSTSYRQAAHSPGLVEALKKISGGETLLRPQHFMTTAADKTEAIQLARGMSTGLMPVRFEVTGFGTLPRPDHHDAAVADRTQVYTPHSCFKVSGVETRRNGITYVRLHEVSATEGQRTLATVLQL